MTMGRRKPATHVVDVNRVAFHGGLMKAHPCRLTKSHIILVPDYGWKFHRLNGCMVGRGLRSPHLDLRTLLPLDEREAEVVKNARVTLENMSSRMNPKYRAHLEEVAECFPCAHPFSVGDDNLRRLQCATCGVDLGEFDPSIDRTGTIHL
jgi:hypothetical protein